MSNPSAHDILSKFEFYFLALTFTLLGVSLQTANLSAAPHVTKIFEISSWVLLAISGLVGISKLQWVSSLIVASNKKDYYHQMVEALNKSKATGHNQAFLSSSGKSVPVIGVLDRYQKNEDTISSLISKLGRKHEIKHHIQWWCFHIAVFAFIAGRVWAAFC